MLLGIDTGGTFTDFLLWEGGQLRFHKCLSTPDDPSRAILAGIADLGLDPSELHLVHGSTVATNAILERKGVRTLFVTNRGMESILQIGRQQRRHLYRLDAPPPTPWLEAEACFGIGGRVTAEGALTLPDEADLDALQRRAREYDAVAVCTLFSFLRPEQELAAGKALGGAEFVTLSHQLLAEAREFERASTTFVNAYVGPLVQRYLQRLRRRLSPRHLFVMHSAGGIMSLDQAGEQPARMVLSGPAGGVVAAAAAGKALQRERLLTFDMGGTSTDVALLDGAPKMTTEGALCDLPVALPMLDIHTIGAGGGSLAWRDAAGLLQVGPDSAGAAPGPVCYGRGGTIPTVTDANLLLGRIPATARLAGSLKLDLKAASDALNRLAEPFDLDGVQLAEGVVALAEESMAGALRRVSVEQGHDPRQFSLFCFGGAGGLHACALAEKLESRQVIIPLASGAFSALGMLAGRRQADRSRSCRFPIEAIDHGGEIDALYRQLEQEAARQMPGLALTFERRADLHYRGQGFQFTLPLSDGACSLGEAFASAHRQAYGHTLDLPIEIVTLRLTAWADTEQIVLPPLPDASGPAIACDHSRVQGAGEVPHYRRSHLAPGHRLTGPALILESTATLWLPPGWALALSREGHLLLEREP